MYFAFTFGFDDIAQYDVTNANFGEIFCMQVYVGGVYQAHALDLKYRLLHCKILVNIGKFQFWLKLRTVT